MNFIKRHPHIVAILALVLIGLFAYSPWMSLTECLNQGDQGNEYMPFFFYHNQAMIEQGEVPLWIHQISSGTPFFAVGDKPIFYPITIATLMLFDYGAAFNMNVLIHLLIGAAGMYALVFFLIKKTPYAFLSGLTYLLNFHVFRKAGKFWGIAWMPWIMLCFYLAFQEKRREDQVLYSILAALGLAFQFHVGSIEIALYTVVVVVLLSLFRLISKRFPERIKTIAMVGVISAVIFAGLIAIKLMPAMEFGALTSRAQGISLEQAKGSYYYWTDFAIWNTDGGTVYAPKSLVLNIFKGCQRGACSAIGVIGTIMLFASLLMWRKKTVLFHWGVLVFALFMITGSFVFEFFYANVPGFDRLQHAARLSIIYIYAASILIAFGAQALAEQIKKRVKPVDTYKTAAFVVVVALIILDLVFVLGFDPIQDTYNFGSCAEYQKAPIMQYITTQYDPEQPFRTKVFESQGRGGVAQYITIPLGLDIVDGQYGGLWIPEYINQYLSVANNYRAKFWGNLNTRYVTMQEKRDIEGLEYVGRFQSCEDCIQPEASGPYLYENKEYLPRAFWTDKAILIVGKNQNAINSGYTLLANPEFRLDRQVMIHGDHDRINDYSVEELSKYSAILLMPGSVDQNSNVLLKRYVDQGGLLVPNILEGKDVVMVDDIQKMLSLTNQSVRPLKIRTTPNTMTIGTQGLDEGFVVINERMYIFPGWEIYADDKQVLDGENERMEQTNLMLSAIHLKEMPEQLRLVYSPDSYETGKNVTTATLLLIALILIVIGWRKWKRSQ